MSETIEDLFNEAIQADEAGGDNDQEEKEENTTDDNTETAEENSEEENNTTPDETDSSEQPTESGETEDVEENLADGDEDIEDPALILQRYKTLQGMYRSQKQKIEELQSTSQTEKPDVTDKVEEPAPTQKEEPPAQQEVDTSWVTEALNSNEDIKGFAEEFPEIHSVLEGSLKAVMERYTQAMSQAFQTLLQQIDQKYQPIASSVTQITAKEKDEAVKSQHPDYPTLIQSQELKDWIDSQPKTLKKAYSEILENGSAEDMIELLNDFKLKTGIKTPQESQPAPKKKPKVAPTTKSKAPSSKPPVDMDDFEQAFYEAIKEGD